ncbi:hypothetical protein JTE90_002501 [Oedothorax gibbosus]|uniref:Uncharacterized protein n=1 Tax=Oedothorax gibbosus TaxID=931172 RepID=A0AAV6UD32_9ARAC|nr:hypothetical protein JTE90_002501 [Oedothorax gibbosus]
MRNNVLVFVFCASFLLDSAWPRMDKKFHCFPSICKFMHCEVKRICEYPKSYLKRKGGLCGCCDECRVLRREGETCNVIFNMMYPPKLVCSFGLKCDDYTFRCVNRSAPIPLLNSFDK